MKNFPNTTDDGDSLQYVFRGIYRGIRIDSANRIIIPAGLRRAFNNVATCFTIVVHPDKPQLIVWPEDKFAELVTEQNYLANFGIPAEMKAGNFINLAKAFELKAGASFKDDITIVGCGSYMEIWRPEDWAMEEVRRSQPAKEALDEFIRRAAQPSVASPT